MISILRYFSLSLTFISVIFFHQKLAGQPSKSLLKEKEKIVTLALGPQRLLLDDEIGSNLSYIGTGTVWLLRYGTIDSIRQHTISLHYTHTDFTNDLSEGIVESIQLSLRYQYQRKLLRLHRLGSSLYVGSYLKFGAFSRSYMYSSYPVTVDTGDLFGSIGLSSSIVKPINRHSFMQIKMSIPVVSYVVSREFVGSTIPEWMSINRLIDYRFGITYTQTLSKKWVFCADYHFLLYRVDRANDVTYGGHRLVLGLGFRL